MFDIDIPKLLRRQWFLLVLSVVCGCAGAITYFYFASPIYQSEAQLLLMPKDPGLAAKGFDQHKDVNSTLSDDLLSTHVMLIQSPAIVSEALKKSGLDSLESLKTSMGGSDRNTTDYVIRKLSVGRGGNGKAKNAKVLQISMRHANAMDVQRVVLSIVEEFQSFISKKYTDVNEMAAGLIEKAKSQLEIELTKSESDYRKFRENAPMLWNGGESTNVFRTEFEQLEATIGNVRVERSGLATRLSLVEMQLQQIDEKKGSDLERLALIDEKNAERIKIFLEIYSGKSETQIFQSQQPERLEAARTEYEALQRLKAREAELIANLGPNHPDILIVRKEIKMINDFLSFKSDKLKVISQDETLTAKKLVNSYVAVLRHDLSTLDAREKLLVQQSQRAEKEAKALVRYELEGETLRSSVDRQKQLFEATVDRLRDINLAKDYGGFVNELIAHPEVGEEVWPKLPICLGIGAMLGAVAGCLIAFAVEIGHRSLRTVKDVEAVTGVPMIARIPLFEAHKRKKTLKSIAERGSTVNPIAFALHASQSQESEIFRGLRTSLFYKAFDSKATTFAMTSPTTGDGKSTVSINLAFSIAQSDRRVLIIDADMRRPQLASLMGVPNEIGLSNVLEGDCEMNDAIQTHPESPNLSLLLSGRKPLNPSELLSSAEFNSLVEAAKCQFDFVIVDCPPVLAVADPLVVASAVDGVLMVVRVNPRSRIELKRAIELLEGVEANVMGTIVNASALETDDGDIEGIGIGYGYGTYGNAVDAYFKK